VYEMLKNATLADLMIREWSKSAYKRIDRHGFVPRSIAQARKFVLDEGMSAFMADLAYAALPKVRNAQRDNAILEGMRTLSRLPHALTWIEYDLKARIDRAVKAYGAADISAAKAPARGGWLLMRHPTMENAFLAMEAISHTTGHSTQNFEISPVMPLEGVQPDGLLSIPNMCPVAYAWTTNDETPPWPKLDRVPHPDVAGVMTGIFSYQSPRLICPMSPFLKDAPDLDKVLRYAVTSGLFYELASDVRYLWALLSAINDTPKEYAVVRPQKGHMVAGQYKRFVEHTVIKLMIPGSKDMTKVAQRITRAARRRAHDVRGFWRKDWRFPLAAFCQHEFESVPDTHLAKCKLCQGRKIWIAEHQRGDASLGFVLHDYSVEHPRQ
jgi:hypothetical protein